MCRGRCPCAATGSCRSRRREPGSRPPSTSIERPDEVARQRHAPGLVWGLPSPGIVRPVERPLLPIRVEELALVGVGGRGAAVEKETLPLRDVDPGAISAGRRCAISRQSLLLQGAGGFCEGGPSWEIIQE